jgi:O-antigen ligase
MDGADAPAPSPASAAWWRGAAAALVMLAALLFPLDREPSTQVLYQIWCGAGLAVASLLWGFGQVTWRWTALWLILCLLIVAHSGVYADSTVVGVVFVTAMYVGISVGCGLRGRTLDIFLIALLAACVVNALEGLLQYLGLAWGLFPWVPESLQRGVAFGVFRQPNPFATFLVIGCVAAAWLAQRQVLTRGMAWTLVGMLQAGIAASGSRIGMLGAVLVALSALVGGYAGLRRDVRFVLVGQLALYAIFAVLMPYLGELHGFETRSVANRLARVSHDSRLVLWQNALRIIEARPWWGWGWHEFGFGHYAVPLTTRFGDEYQTLDNGHNLLLHLAAELGVPAALIILGGAAVFFVAGVRRQDWGADRFFPALVVVLLLQHSAVEYPLWTVSLAFLFAVMLGVCVGQGAAPIGRAYRLLYPALCVCLVVFAVEADRQYARITRLYETPSLARVAKANALREAEKNWLFLGNVEFAQLLQLHPSPENARDVLALSERVLHFSAEPVVAARAVESAWLAGDQRAFAYHLERFRTAFPHYFASWKDRMAAARPALVEALAKPGPRQ